MGLSRGRGRFLQLVMSIWKAAERIVLEIPCPRRRACVASATRTPPAWASATVADVPAARKVPANPGTAPRQGETRAAVTSTCRDAARETRAVVFCARRRTTAAARSVLAPRASSGTAWLSFFRSRTVEPAAAAPTTAPARTTSRAAPTQMRARAWPAPRPTAAVVPRVPNSACNERDCSRETG